MSTLKPPQRRYGVTPDLQPADPMVPEPVKRFIRDIAEDWAEVVDEILYGNNTLTPEDRKAVIDETEETLTDGYLNIVDGEPSDLELPVP